MKQEYSSYEKITQQLNIQANQILFLTDVYGESVAAAQAGLGRVYIE